VAPSGNTITATTYTINTAASSSNAIYPGMTLTGTNSGILIINQTSGTPAGNGAYTVFNPSNLYNGSYTAASGPVVILNQALQAAVPSAAAITLSRSTYAVPGETVFSFISSPSNKDQLDLTPFKELTNTPIGGRGTFPNGPDVLFVNAYLTQGAPVLANLVLRWGEAQA
jgi:hypothetical protein